jgi:hypothetical protein
MAKQADVNDLALVTERATHYPVDVSLAPVLTERNRLTCAFRPLLALPHVLLVGGPLAIAGSSWWRVGEWPRIEWGAPTGVLGAMAAVVAFISWFAILFTGAHPPGLWNLAAYYLRWRVRAISYLTLLRDEYPPFADSPYPATLVLAPPIAPRNRLTVALRIFLAIPQIIVVSLLGVAWAVTTIVAWVNLLFTGNYPRRLYQFGVAMLRWSTRVEAYVLLLRDEYPPFFPE